MKVLLIENGVLTSRYVKRIIQSNAVECDLISCMNKSEALEIARKKHPNLIIMDINKPCTDGLELVKELKNVEPGIYILLISVLDQLVWLKKTISLGVDDYLVKPFAEPELILRIRKALKFIEKNNENLTRKFPNIEIELQKTDRFESICILTSEIAHDFNNFLATMLGNITLAKRYKDNPDKIHEKLNIIEKATLQAKGVIYKLSALFQNECMVKEVLDIGELIKNSTYFALSSSNVSCIFSFSEDLRTPKIDSVQMGRVLSNLILNAVQAMPLGGTIRMEAKNITFKATKNERPFPLPEGDYIKISVKDEGYGIPEENRHKIFNPYFSTKPEGSGLGLAISQEIVKKHGGYIDLQSQIGAGTTFDVYLPAADI